MMKQQGEIEAYLLLSGISLKSIMSTPDPFHRPDIDRPYEPDEDEEED